MKDNNSKETTGGYPKNDYSGLNSLRARLRKSQSEKGKHKGDTTFIHDKDTIYMVQGKASIYNNGSNSFQDNDTITSSLLMDGRYIGPPIYFFFVLNTDRLTDHSQLVNLDGIAR